MAQRKACPQCRLDSTPDVLGHDPDSALDRSTVEYEASESQLLERDHRSQLENGSFWVRDEFRYLGFLLASDGEGDGPTDRGLVFSAEVVVER